MIASRGLEKQEILPFNLFNFYDKDSPIPEVHARIRQGTLPFDCLFRLSAIGCRQVDPDNTRKLLRWNILLDMVNNADNEDRLNPVTQAIIFGQRPDAIIDNWQSGNRPAYTMLDPMYYCMGNLTRSIRELRVERGTSLDSLPSHMDSPESQRCRSLSRALWRVIVKKIHPEWLTNPRDYCPPTISFNNIYYPGDRLMLRRNVARAVISDPTLLGIYTEVLEIGVKGIGPSGQESLSRLLSDEHPELV